jgi:putative PIN family toxin of toxin-antitoxin system
VRVLLDTNVWVSAVIRPSGFPAQIITAWQDGRFDVVVSWPLLAELTNVLSRPRILVHYPLVEEDAPALIEAVVEQAIFIQVKDVRPLCRDAHDDIVLATAIAGRATYIVSRDEDITRSPDLAQQLELHSIRVITVRRFLQEIAI